jgi:hypothetical protein
MINIMHWMKDGLCYDFIGNTMKRKQHKILQEMHMNYNFMKIKSNLESDFVNTFKEFKEVFQISNGWLIWF